MTIKLRKWLVSLVNGAVSLCLAFGLVWWIDPDQRFPFWFYAFYAGVVFVVCTVTSIEARR